MMFYTMVTGWMLFYASRYISGSIDASSTDATANAFQQMLNSPGYMTLFAALVIVLCIGVCALGLQNGIEKITKVSDASAHGLMVVLGRSILCAWKGAEEGLKFLSGADFESFENGFTLFCSPPRTRRSLP